MGNNLVKLVQRKRSNERSGNKNQQNGENSNGMPVASSSNDNQQMTISSIFMLNRHCFDELFEYLSLEDLHSLGQTCKSMQQMTGEFFARNYSAAQCTCLRDGVYLIDTDTDTRPVSIEKCVPIPGFNQFITWIAIGNNVFAEKKHIIYRTHHHYNLSKFEYFKLHSDEFTSVKKLTLTNVRLNKRIVGYFLKVLPNIKVLELAWSTITQDLYDVLLKYCKNVRHIRLYQVTFKTKHNWLLQRYEKLENLELGLRIDERIDELCTFFELNSHLRSFTCDSWTLMSNKDALLNSKVKLDTFELENCDHGFKFEEEWNLSSWNLLCQLYTNGFFKRLYVYTWSINLCDQLSSIQFLDQLSLGSSSPDGLGSLSSHLIEYAEKAGFQHYRWIMQSRVEQLMDVDRLYLPSKLLDILLFIKKLRNLKKIKLFRFKSAEILQLDVLNAEREKLAGAKKVTIYVPDAVFLSTKWATRNGTTNFSLIEMKRAASYEWNRSIYACDAFHPYYFHLPPGMK